MTALWAHTPGAAKKWHDLIEHLEAVAETAARFAEPWGAERIARALGAAHDIGKADPDFQAYLRACDSGLKSKKCPHSAAGAVAAKNELGALVLAILGHHTGLPNYRETKVKLAQANPQTVAHARRLWEEVRPDIALSQDVPSWCKSELSQEFLLRMLFSALADADYLDTEAHMHGGYRTSTAKYPTISEYRETIRAKMDAFKRDKTAVSRVRTQVLSACRASAPKPPGLFRLTVPTGGGKTLSGLSFALDHAAVHGLRRVIFAIPYTSIIDQTATVYKGIFGSDQVIEHHSAINAEDDEHGFSLSALRRKWATENWDCPLVVTTTVQLFESIFSNRPSKCRKLHNLAQSVIILDEVQSLPADKLGPILSVLQELVNHYGCSVVLCTATQPKFDEIASDFVSAATEIVPQFREHFTLMKRVTFDLTRETWSTEKVAQELTVQAQALVVLNTRKSALKVARACSEPNSVLHLSTLLCGHHRKQVITEAKRRLDSGEPVHLVSTQVIEAGVDLDFPYAMRAMGPLDRVIQTAGRCNREGKQSNAICRIFDLEGERVPKGAYETAISATWAALNEPEAMIDSEAAATVYWRQLFQDTETGSTECATDRALIQKARQELAFASVAEAFRMIEDDNMAVLVVSYAEEYAPGLIEDWRKEIGRKWMRRVQPYTVSLRQRDVEQLQASGKLQPHESGMLLYVGPYDNVYGLDPDADDTLDLIK